jgi:hypothetical protein
MSCVESMLTVMHAYFAHSPKRHVEFERLATTMNKKGQKIPLNVKTSWISMLKPAKQIMNQYSVLLLKMHLDETTIVQPAKNVEHLLDLQTVLGLACLLPMLE